MSAYVFFFDREEKRQSNRQTEKNKERVTKRSGDRKIWGKKCYLGSDKKGQTVLF
jgi:hypothetical protein